MPAYEQVYPPLQCCFCGVLSTDVIVYHQRTMYNDAESNYVAACPKCRVCNDEYWDDMWSEYYYNCY